jgi:hypothetical protein
MQFIEWLLGVSPDAGSGLLESWLFCFACGIFGIGVWWKKWVTISGAGGSAVETASAQPPS